LRPLAYVWPYAAFFWPVMVWAFVPEFLLIIRSHGAAPSERKDGGSMPLILIANQIGFIAAFGVAFHGGTSAPLAWRPVMFWTGLAVLAAGSGLRRYCFRALGQYFTGDVRVRENQPVIQTGPYAWVRHPSYTAGMMMFGGVGVALGNWVSVALLLGTIVPVYLYRVHVEERALAEALGEPYRAYMRAHKRFIPWVI
jgi:protein-S-isoprenylcysteine O-methyltransferase Ste14